MSKIDSDSTENPSEQNDKENQIQDPVQEAIIEKVKTKKPRSPAQLEAMRRAQEKRTENLKRMKELKEKTDKEDAKILQRKQKEEEAEKAKRIIDSYEIQKKKVAEQKRLERLARKPVYNLPREKQPAAIREDFEQDSAVVEFDTAENSPDPFMGIFGGR